uniref:SCP domain-containing protein n=1 Tax=Scylla olivacea TaxID=85551 RepID=A0A0P4WH71_SCYOL
MCKSTPSTCSIYQEGVRGSDKQAILESHNTYRAKVARGEEGQGLPGPQYSAADMQQLSWNEELAQVAQAWASACPDYHDCHDCRKVLSRDYYVGQNIFYEWSSTNAGSVWDTAVRLWYEEVKYVPNYLTKRFYSMDHAVIGHYTQLVWAETREVGCGAAYHDCIKVFKGKSWKLKCKIYVCNYGPTGNFLDKPLYTIGPAASACPQGSRPSVQYPGLCNSH